MKHGGRYVWTAAALRRPTTIAAVITASAVVAAAFVVPSALAGQVGARAQAAGPNLAAKRPITGSAPCRADEAASNAVNGSVSAGRADKWCSGASAKALQVDLGATTMIGSVVVRHAEAGGERAAYNTRAFDVAVSADGSHFTTVVQVRNNTAAATERTLTPASARYVRLSVIQPEQRSAGGAARIYEFEVYGSTTPSPTRTVTPTVSTSASPTVSPTISPTASRTASPTASPTTSPTAVPPGLPPNTGKCFPYPAYDSAKGPHTTLTVESGAKVDPKHLAVLRKMFVDEWPAAWQTFAAPADIAKGDRGGVSKVYITAGGQGMFSEGEHWLPDKDIPEWFDDGFEGHFLHEASHMVGPTYPDDTPRFYKEGITDFVRYVAHGRDRVWNPTDKDGGFGGAMDRDEVWNFGYALAARYMLWLTQHYDTSGNRYEKVRALNVALNQGETDYKGLFTRVWGKSYDQLFDEYVKNPVINEHC